jgi:Fur family peroxide stress response transcriptional regulator
MHYLLYKLLMKTVKEYVEELNQVCRKKELRITPQRLEVYKTIVRTTEHPSAEAILKKVRKRIPNISHDTVYRTLTWLERNKLIFQVGVVDGVARFDGNMKFHVHYICDECGKIGDIFPERFDISNLTAMLPPGFSAERALVEFRGGCPSCRH